MNRIARVIVNAGSGTGFSPGRQREIEAVFAAHGVQAELLRVDSGEAILKATDDALARGTSLVVAGGGDGTVSAVASRLVHTDVPMGVLPLGTLNHFAKDLGMPLELPDAIAAMARGERRAVDVGEVNGHIFINNSSLGLYPDIVLDRERQRRRLGRGKWRALLAACLHAARRYPVLDLQLSVDGQDLRRRSPFVFVGNNAYRMEGFDIGARDRLSDGQLSLYLTQRTGRFGLVLLALRALFRRLEQAQDFDMLQAAQLEVRTRQSHLRVATDGEVTLMATPLRYRVLPGALSVIAPARPPAPDGATA